MDYIFDVVVCLLKSHVVALDDCCLDIGFGYGFWAVEGEFGGGLDLGHSFIVDNCRQFVDEYGDRLLLLLFLFMLEVCLFTFYI